MNESTECWHFARADRMLGYGDGRLIEVGAIHKVDVMPKCCIAGLHGSIRALDALSYSAGPIISRVRIWGLIDKQSDKLCGQVRKYLAVSDATEELRSFARWCALQVVHFWDAPWIVRQYLETGDESIRVAASDATMAAIAAAEVAAWNAARAAMAATQDPARVASWAAGWAADAARVAAWVAANADWAAQQNAELDSRLRKLLNLEAA